MEYEIRFKKKVTKIIEGTHFVNANKYVGLKLAEIRKLNKKSTIEVSKAVKMSRQNLSNIEHGRIGLNINMLERFCKYYNVQAFEILPF